MEAEKMWKMKKGFMLTVMCLLCSFFMAVPGIQAASVSETKDIVEQKYEEKLNAIRKSSGSGLRYGYIDFSGDGIVELVVEYKDANSGSGFICEVYTYRNDSVESMLTIDEYGLSKCIFYKKSGAVILYGSGHGSEWYRYFKLNSKGNYKFIAQKSRTMSSGTGTDGEWSYLNGKTKAAITAKKFKKLTASLKSGKKKTFRKWKYLQ